METKDLVQRIREEVIHNAINKSKSFAGNDLNNVKLSIIEFKDILYDTLRKIELEEVEIKKLFQ